MKIKTRHAVVLGRKSSSQQQQRYLVHERGPVLRSGNQNSRPVLLRAQIYADFRVNGKDVIETVRTERPHEYLKIVASILPKELHVTEATLDGMTEDDLIEFSATVRAIAVGRAGLVERFWKMEPESGE